MKDINELGICLENYFRNEKNIKYIFEIDILRRIMFGPWTEINEEFLSKRQYNLQHVALSSLSAELRSKFLNEARALIARMLDLIAGAPNDFEYQYHLIALVFLFRRDMPGLQNNYKTILHKLNPTFVRLAFLNHPRCFRSDVANVFIGAKDCPGIQKIVSELALSNLTHINYTYFNMSFGDSFFDAIDTESFYKAIQISINSSFCKSVILDIFLLCYEKRPKEFDTIVSFFVQSIDKKCVKFAFDRIIKELKQHGQEFLTHFSAEQLKAIAAGK